MFEYAETWGPHMKRILFTLAIVLSPLWGSSGQSASPLRETMESYVESRVIAGSVTIIASKDRVLSCEAVGHADIATQEVMRPDHLFWIASMTKPLTAVCVLQLQDEGLLTIDDPVAKYLPEFQGQWKISQRDKGRLLLTRPRRAVTIRDLLTHTSGLSDTERPRNESTLAELVGLYSKMPLYFEPGSKWAYSNPGINTLGRIVEVVSGLPFHAALQQRVLDPCAMKDTTLWPTPAQAKHLATAYRRDNEGNLAETDNAFLPGGISNRKRTPVPGGGLYSTAKDVTAFYQMMLNGGMSHGVQVLKKETVSRMTRMQTEDFKKIAWQPAQPPDRFVDPSFFLNGMSWGLGFQVVKEPRGVMAPLSAGTFGHGGAYGTQSWADPKRGVVMVLMIQRADFSTGDNAPVHRGFQEAAHQQIRFLRDR